MSPEKRETVFATAQRVFATLLRIEKGKLKMKKLLFSLILSICPLFLLQHQLQAAPLDYSREIAVEEVDESVLLYEAQGQRGFYTLVLQNKAESADAVFDWVDGVDVTAADPDNASSFVLEAGKGITLTGWGLANTALHVRCSESGAKIMCKLVVSKI